MNPGKQSISEQLKGLYRVDVLLFIVFFPIPPLSPLLTHDWFLVIVYIYLTHTFNDYVALCENKFLS